MDLRKFQIQTLVIQIRDTKKGVFKMAASYAIDNDQSYQFLKELYDQLTSLELDRPTRERLGDEISDEILQLFNN